MKEHFLNHFYELLKYKKIIRVGIYGAGAAGAQLASALILAGNHKIDAFVAGVGTGGTISGIGRFLKSQNPEIEIIVADPEGSVVADAVNEGAFEYTGGQWLVEGIGEDYIPDNLDLSVIDEGIYVSDKKAFEMLNKLLQEEGILAGTSCGTLLEAAVDWCKAQKEPKKKHPRDGSAAASARAQVRASVIRASVIFCANADL